MASFSNKVRERLVSGIKRFQPILSSAKARDVNDKQKFMCVSFHFWADAGLIDWA